MISTNKAAAFVSNISVAIDDVPCCEKDALNGRIWDELSNAYMLFINSRDDRA